ncbi:cytochrome c3 family protein [Hyphomicrobium sp. LHD-15]|uniref:cytochrome c3 family protein n=1 Tax=Hyphomicrobium sp. LHD-15 TaxID=3072142 RepID=UPI00280F65B1|nr:cytochrome c3 family protein [Hyphomicrobium sp. LHD-15]MDQ8699763.1 hypothetical protein [Hyphomicrobium sp. LHD-15]
MWKPGWIGWALSPKAERRAAFGSLRDRIAVLLALVTFVGLGAALLLTKGTQFLMPGPLASAHGGIEKCSACHTKSGSGKVSWLHGLVAGDPEADSKACLTCHKMPDTAFNAHGASAEALEQSTKRLTKIAAELPAPQSARAQNAAFPTHDVVARGLYCATCHQEHQGTNFSLNKISNEQCRSCHVMKFDSFDGNHPKFESYPFKKRTRIIYDHAGHFGKHYPEVAKKNPAKSIPETCSTCHNTREDKRVMAVAPFEQTCTGCHLDQIVGKERVSGPKGVAFLSLPGLDVQTLTKKKAAFGEWPEASEAALTPFMKVMISRNDRGRALLKTVDSLNLQDLADASDDQIKAVSDLVWEIKRLFYALIKGKASDVLGDFNIGGGAKLSATLVADLTASIPRDVVVSAQQQWLPNLAAEMANRPAPKDQQNSGWSPTVTDSGLAAGSENKAARKTDTANAKSGEGGKARAAKEMSPPMRAGVGDAQKASVGDAQKASVGDAQKPAQSEDATVKTYTTNAGPDDGEGAADAPGGAVGARLPLPSGTPRSIDAARNKDAERDDRPEGSADKAETAKSKRDGPGPADDASKADANVPADAPAASETANTKSDSGTETPSSRQQPQGKATEQTDDLLFPTEEELRGVSAASKEAAKPAQPDGAAANAEPDSTAKADEKAPAGTSSASKAAVSEPQTRVAPVISIESDVDPESWAEYGGWYRQDFAIFYRPTGHKDKFIYSWLFLTGPQAPKGDAGPAAAVFDALTGKDAQGSCAKCHSVDEIQGKGRVVNFSPPSAKSKKGRFTSFIHEPHFGLLETRGCLSCHELEKGSPYLKSYEQGNPQNFASNFGAVKKDLCQTCHTSNMARQDCLLCHKYHVNGAITPIMSTKLPTQ